MKAIHVLEIEGIPCQKMKFITDKDADPERMRIQKVAFIDY